MQKYLIDSAIIIDCLRQDKPVLEFIKSLTSRKETAFLISSITTAELFSGKSAQNKRTQKILSDLLSAFEEIAVDRDIAILAGKFRCKYQSSLSDAIIASTAYFNKATLISRDKIFLKIKEIKTKIL
ncbi:PIN domain-containing protein [Candidatus Parcubacteria bacterium]|nr:PIN domain-containing protein [Candidatus Parcubacteria bacterium]